MKRFLTLFALALVVLLIAAVLVMRARYGGPTTPFPDMTKPPLLGREAIGVVASLDEPPGNIAVAPDGRLFFTYHPEARPPLHVLELVNGKPVPYPSAEWQKRFTTPLSVRVDRQGRLWVLDIGFHGIGQPRLLAFELASGKLVHQWDMPDEVAGFGSFVQDFQIDAEGRWLYFADLNILAKHPALIVYDSHAKRGRRVLQDHPSVKDRPHRIVNHGRPMILLGGLYAMHPAVDSIALDAKGEWLYYGPMSHDTLFRVRVSELRDAAATPRPEAYGPKPQTDGIAIDGADNLYMTEVEHGTIALLRPDRTLHTLVRDERLRWPDGLSLSADGWLYVTDSDLAHVVLKSRSTIRAHRPYSIYRVRTAKPCVPAPRRLCPVDEGARDPSFRAFREALIDALKRKDEAALQTMIDPGVRTDFGGGSGFDELRDRWSELETALRMGGTFREGMFWAPYVYSAWPEELDAFEHVAAIRANVPVRSAPRADAEVVTTVDWAILRVMDHHADWLRVSEGWVSESDVRSPIDYRAGFAKRDGRWILQALVAGD